jgi:hypothetical protein
MHSSDDINIFKPQARQINGPIHRKHCNFIANPSRLMQFMEILSVWCENRMKHITTPIGEDSELLILKQVVHRERTVL